MNKKYLSLSLILFVCALTAGCSAKPTVAVPSATPSVAPAQKEAITSQQRIAQAMANGSGVRCVMQKKDSVDTITFELLGKKNRAYGTALSGGNGTGYMLNDGEYVYIWSEPSKKGTKMPLMATASAQESYQDFTKEETQKTYEDQGYTYDCTEAEFTDGSFTPPKEVTFSDLSSLMDTTSQQKMMDAMKKYQGQ